MKLNSATVGAMYKVEFAHGLHDSAGVVLDWGLAGGVVHQG